MASYLPRRFIIFPGNVIYFLSISEDKALIAAAKSELVTEPNNLSPEPTFDGNLTLRAFISSALLLAASTIDCSLKARCFRFSVKTLRAETVAITAFPCGIRKLRP
jgi:hypothetical protein